MTLNCLRQWWQNRAAIQKIRKSYNADVASRCRRFMQKGKNAEDALTEALEELNQETIATAIELGKTRTGTGGGCC